MKWNSKSDVWSIGCILYELYSGRFLFPTHEDYEHIAMIEKLCGRVNKWMIDRCDNNDLFKNFIVEEEYVKYRGTYFDWPREAVDQESVDAVRRLQSLERSIDQQEFLFKDLIKKCL